MLLEGKVCLITGSNRGIGLAVLRRFVEEGALVYANARSSGSLDERIDTINVKSKGQAVPLYFDVCDSSAARQAFMRIKKEHGKLDILVNNAGIMEDALIGMISKDLMHKVFEVNVFAVIDMIQLATKLMKRKGNGSIINIASIAGTQGSEGQAVYSSSKGAIVALTKEAAKELAPCGIRVNALAPGFIETDLFKSIGEKKVKECENQVKMGRLGQSRDVADACVFFGSDLSDYITGQILGIDGLATI